MQDGWNLNRCSICHKKLIHNSGIGPNFSISDFILDTLMNCEHCRGTYKDPLPIIEIVGE